jgi:hypothetical protein
MGIARDFALRPCFPRSIARTFLPYRSLSSAARLTSTQVLSISIYLTRIDQRAFRLESGPINKLLSWVGLCFGDQMLFTLIYAGRRPQPLPLAVRPFQSTQRLAASL